MQAYACGNVPIYWGDKRAKEIFNPDSFIDCTGLSMEEAVEKVKKVDQDDELYLKMLKAPILLNPSHREEYTEKLRLWLKNIVDQDPEAARRVPKRGKMAVYEENYRKKVKMEKAIKKHKKLYAIIKKVMGGRL